jgi:hypothetical protein
MAKPTTPEQHEQALRLVVEKLMCCDIARKHAAKLPERQRVTCTRRYQEIAKRLLCMRAKSLPIMQRIRKNELIERIKQSDHDEMLWERDLAAVFYDQSYTLEQRREALRQLEEFKNEHEQRRGELLQESVAASLSRIHFRASVERLARQRKQMGKYEFFRHLDAIIGRYVNARISGATWAAPLSLLQLLALERRRDRDSLWSFLDDFFERWEETSAPRGTHAKHAIILESLADGQSMKEVVAALEKVGFRLSADGIKHYANVRAIASRLRRASQQFK